MDVDDSAKRLRTLPERIEGGVVEIKPVSVAVDHGTAELEITHGALEFVGSGFRILYRNVSEARIAVRPLVDLFGEEIVGLARQPRRDRGIAHRLHAGPGDRQHGLFDTGLIHGFQALIAEVDELPVKLLGQRRRHVRHGRTPDVDQARREEMLLQRDLLDHAIVSGFGFCTVRQNWVLPYVLHHGLLCTIIQGGMRPQQSRVLGYRVMDRPLISAKNDKSQVQVIARAATILRALEDENAGLSLGQIAQRVNLARSTVQRIVAALETESLVIAATPNGRVRLGPAILRLAASVRSDFIAAARPFLERLSAELQETVDLAVVKKDHLVFIDQVIGPQRLRTVSAVGETFPLHCTANGKAYLAQLSEAGVEKLIGRTFEPRTPNTITRIEALIEELAKVRANNGIAIDREEHSLGICAAGVSLRDPLGNSVAISVPVPSQRFVDQQATIVARLLATKHAMETNMDAAAA